MQATTIGGSAVFTGIVEDVGRIAAVERAADGARVVIETADLDAGALALGESVAVDGACLTVIAREGASAARRGTFAAYVSAETLSRTTLGDRVPGDRVSLERALALGDRLGGHLVQGHVDATGRIGAVTPAGESVRMRVDVPEQLARYLIEKGSIALDGVSLTINRVDDGAAGTAVEVNLVPHTLARTALASKSVGARVNIEADMLAKHLERLAFFRGSRCQ